MEKRNNTPGVLFQRIQCGRSEAGFQIRLVFHRLLADAVVLDLVPNLFVRIVFGRPLRQKEHPQLAPMRPHIITHLLGMVEGSVVGQHDQGAGHDSHAFMPQRVRLVPEHDVRSHPFRQAAISSGICRQGTAQFPLRPLLRPGIRVSVRSVHRLQVLPHCRVAHLHPELVQQQSGQNRASP